MAVASRSFHPSRIGFGSIRGAPRPAGRIEKSTCAAMPGTVRPIRPMIVPPITREPTLRRRSAAVLRRLTVRIVELAARGGGGRGLRIVAVRLRIVAVGLHRARRALRVIGAPARYQEDTRHRTKPRE